MIRQHQLTDTFTSLQKKILLSFFKMIRFIHSDPFMTLVLLSLYYVIKYIQLNIHIRVDDWPH